VDSLSDEGKAALTHNWKFLRYIHADALRGRRLDLAVKRLDEAVSEIRNIAQTEPLTAAEGIVQLCEQVGPAFYRVNRSRGTLRRAVVNSLEGLMPLLIDSSADEVVRGLWLGRLFEALRFDEIEFLEPVRNKWVEICRYPDFVNRWAESTLPMLRKAWSAGNTCERLPDDFCECIDEGPYEDSFEDYDEDSYWDSSESFHGETICLDCLVEAGDEGRCGEEIMSALADMIERAVDSEE
jgi:hypothetical protein